MSIPALHHPVSIPRKILFQGTASGYGATVKQTQTSFKVWAPNANNVDLVILSAPSQRTQTENSWANTWSEVKNRTQTTLPMTKKGGDFQLDINRSVAPPGTLYMYRLNGGDLRPDPCSEYQPEDVHGPSMVVNAQAFQWSDQKWKTPQDLRNLNLYRLHVGAWTPDGTLQSARVQLGQLKQLGFNAIELFPVTEFPGRRNWGYDPAGLYAVENAYGKPEDLKQFIDDAHRQGMSVLLDGVYNHLSAEGQYLGCFDDNFTKPYATPWGPSINWKNPKARQYIMDNARFWLEQYHADGFRLDSTHNIPDDALKDIVRNAQEVNPNAILLAEDERNQNTLMDPLKDNGFSLKGQWDFRNHHALQSVMTQTPYKGASITVSDWVNDINRGFPPPNPGNQGTSLGAYVRRLTNFLIGIRESQRTSLGTSVRYDQSHDEIANDSQGRRNVTLMGGPRDGEQKGMMASVIKFLLPGVPLSFMGQEYASNKPFKFFCSTNDFQREVAADRPEGVDAVNGQAFEKSRFLDSDWTSSSTKQEHLRLTQAISKLRQELPALWQGDRAQMHLSVHPSAKSVAVLHRVGKENPDDQVLALINFSNQNYTDAQALVTDLPDGRWTEVLHTADKQFGGDGKTNPHKHIAKGPHTVNLPPWSISVWHSDAEIQAKEPVKQNTLTWLTDLSDTLKGYFPSVSQFFHT